MLGAETELAEMKAGMLSSNGKAFDIAAAIKTQEKPNGLRERVKALAETEMTLEEIAAEVERPVPVVRAMLRNG